MQLVNDVKGGSLLYWDYPPDYRSKLLSGLIGHEELARAIAESDLKTYMIITCADRLAEEHWDDPEYLHKTNHIIISEALEEARSLMANKYYSREELDAIIEKRGYPSREFNYREDEGRGFKFRLEDELFHYQEMLKLSEVLLKIEEDSVYLVDEEGYHVEGPDDDLITLTDPEEILKNRERLFRRWLMPRIRTECDRVYNMPMPLDHWDYRSSWHQLFLVEIPSEGITLVHRGGSGSSGAREENGRWAHTFAFLAKELGIETPTFFVRYDCHNVWREEFRQPTFATLTYDLRGNYQSSSEVMKPLFQDRTWMTSHDDDRRIHTYVRAHGIWCW